MPGRLWEKSLDELELVEQNYIKQIQEEPDYNSHPSYILVLEAMHRQARSKSDQSYELYVKKKLLATLIKYGTYLKTVYQKDDNAAHKSLIKALKYDKYNPIANYRLGFLAYKKKDYSKAINYFQTALKSNLDSYLEYRLEDQQIYYAHLYLTNSSLHIAANTHMSLRQLNLHTNQEALPGLEMSSLYALVEQTDHYLHQHAFYKMERGKQSTCSKEECEELAYNPELNSLVLYSNDRTNELIFNNNSVLLSEDQNIMLRHFLMNSNEEKALTRTAFMDVFEQLEVMERVAFVQRIRRLRRKLIECNIPPIIETTSSSGEPAYYFNNAIEYTVLFRVDDGMAKEYIAE
ncbi:tetratricopeptide repeat protein [Bacillus sp. NTK071]|uniref:tetratricopeptide repeat protein n=1 Tax=Bacillus sp. NTK071 TaxID=2802175 RepID=UPI001A90C9CE|nr:tetratricopeptide repeat protein [Bacillus sp. NTK071]MBN8208920.1 tetratricopeptide repeat protein [Bacillus sp. NTK071]